MKTLNIWVLMFLFLAAGNLRAVEEEVSQPVRTKAVTEALKGQSQVVAVYARGLCCPSCAIGIRKKVSKLAFVDQKQLTKGVDLDAKHQLAMIAIKPGATAYGAALAKAIDAAGYPAVHLYTFEGGSLRTQDISGYVPQ